MFSTYPLELFVCREVLEHYFFNGEFDQRRHLIFTSSIAASSLVVSLLSCDLGIFLELTGGLSATALAFIFPSICYLHLTKETRNLPPGSIPSLTSNSSSSRRNQNSNGDSNPNQIGGEYEDDEDEEGLEDLEGRVDLDDVELPLRPGANIRHRPPSAKRNWWQSTKPLAIAVAVFGIVVLCVSGEFGDG